MDTQHQYTIARLRPVNGVQLERLKIDKIGWVKADDYLDWVEERVDLGNYRYFWFEDIIMTKTVGDGIFTVKTEVIWSSGKYFINAYVETYEDVCVNNKHLATQMTNLGWTHIARNIGTDSYWTEHFDPEKDKLITLEGAIVD